MNVSRIVISIPADCKNVVISADSICGVTLATPEILELALRELKIKAQFKKLEIFECEYSPKANPKDAKQKVLVRTWP
jgi:hypothetical protein